MARLFDERRRRVVAVGASGSLVGEELVVFGAGDERPAGWFGWGAAGVEVGGELPFEADEGVFDLADLERDSWPEVLGSWVAGPRGVVGSAGVDLDVVSAGWFVGEDVEVGEVAAQVGGGPGERVDAAGEEVDVVGGAQASAP
jgi:hypothetical protein